MEEQLKTINEKLNAIVTIFLDIAYSNNKESNTEQFKIKKLKDSGMSNETISIIFNKTPDAISKLYYKANKSKSKKGEKNG